METSEPSTSIPASGGAAPRPPAASLSGDVRGLVNSERLLSAFRLLSTLFAAVAMLATLERRSDAVAHPHAIAAVAPESICQWAGIGGIVGIALCGVIVITLRARQNG